MAYQANAIIYCEGGVRDPLGKTAHGLLRTSNRYRIVGLVDSETAGRDAGELLDGKHRGVPIFPSVAVAAELASPAPCVMVIGIAPTGFDEEGNVISAAIDALRCGLSVHSGLHLYLAEIPVVRALAESKRLEVFDVRRPPSRRLKMLTGDILSVRAPRLLVTGQDAACGKRTAAIRICNELRQRNVSACMIGTGQTSWLQGLEFGVRLDALPLDFAGGELEGEIMRAYEAERPDVFIVEGQGSLLNPGYSAETLILLTASRPSLLVYVSAPERTHYIDFPDFPIRSAEEEIALLEAISGAYLVGLVVNGGNLGPQVKRDVPVAFGADGDLSALVDNIVRNLTVREA